MDRAIARAPLLVTLRGARPGGGRHARAA
eukprot:SAG25_NODE_3168_length_1187_cov_16.443934_1_plen_28_part_10